ncbi:MAG: hypothetical protein WCT02_00020 [Candidatus Paceibacterota bacterium]
MKLFLVKLLIFLIPIAVLLLFPFTVFVLSGEFLSAQTVVRQQNESSQDILYMSAFTGINDKSYKIFQTIVHDPEIAVFGRSRTLTFRSDFFKDGTAFYNAGVPMHKVSELREFLANIPKEAKLKVILLDLSNFLTDERAPEETVRGGEMLTGLKLFLVSGWREVYISYLNKKFSLSGLLREKAILPSIGLNALIRHEGYRKDGSLSRGNAEEIKVIIEKVPNLIAQNLSGIVAGKPVASFDSTADPENLTEIGNFLEASRQRNVYVIGYFSPYAEEIYEKIQSLPGEYGDNIRKVPSQLRAVFSQHGYRFYDLRDLKAIGSSDKELYDPAHPTEKATLRLLVKLAENEPVLGGYVDVPELRKRIVGEPY